MAEFEITQQKLPLHEAVVKLELIRDGLREITENLRDSIQVIEGESLDKVKSEAEFKAEDLEAEVLRLREELKMFKDILGGNLENKNPDKNTF